MISEDELRKILRFAPATRISTFVGPLNAAMEEFGISDDPDLAAFVATLAHESGEFHYTEEIASGAAYDNRVDLGNTKPEAIAAAVAHSSSPGRWWKGHGLIQVTGYDNHVACGEALGIDLVDEPTLIAQPVGACRSSAWFWRNAKLRDGTTIDLSPIAKARDFLAVSRIVNLGDQNSHRFPNHWDERSMYYDRAVAVLAARSAQED